MSGEQVQQQQDNGLMARVEAWRAGIDADADPVRVRLIEAMARRGAALQAPARALIEHKLAALMSAYGQHESTAEDAGAGAPQGRALPDVVKQLNAHAPTHLLSAREVDGEAELLRYVRNTWTRLSADRRLTQSLARVPDKAGPLNSLNLVHRALATMRETSPGYFHHFVAQVDALLALDQLMQAITQPPPAPATTSTPAAPRQRKPRAPSAK